MNIMFGFMLLAGLYRFTDAYFKLSIIPFDENIIMNENDNLNLTCQATIQESLNNVSLDMSWILPIRKSNIGDRISVQAGYSQRSVTVRKLRESDTGLYICQVEYNGIIKRQKVNVLVRKEKYDCMKPFFDCGNGKCINWQDVCDGYEDCKDGSDEFLSLCGDDPRCEGKFLCDGKCIPLKLCCDPTTDPTCSHELRPCCHRVFNGMFPLDMMGIHAQETPVQYKYHNIGFYQSTVYTMISCAIAFIFMSTVMLIAVCRFRMRRIPWYLQSSRSSQRQRFWRSSLPQTERRANTATVHGSTAQSIQQHTAQLDQSETIDPENFVLLTYDVNSGFEIAEYGRPKPPPYTESDVGIPPPPYSSMVDITSENANNTTEASNQVPTNTN